MVTTEKTKAVASILKKILLKELENREAKKDPHQLRDVVTWAEWISDPYYSGAVQPMLYEYWKLEVGGFLESGSHEWVITGSLGGGKSTAGFVVIMRKVYELSCYQYPQRLFGLGDLGDIVFAILGPGGSTGNEAYIRLRRAIDSSRYFFDHCPRDTYRNSSIQFPTHRMRVAPGSGRTRGSAALSTDLFGVMLDEANFYKLAGSSASGDVQMARDTYYSTTTRRRSRFLSQEKDPSFSLLVSSVDHDLSFTTQRINEAKKNNERQKVTFSNPWLTKPEGTYSDERFYVFTGTDELDARIVDNPLEVAHIMAKGFRDSYVYEAASLDDATVKSVVSSLGIEQQANFLEIPEDFRPDFLRNMEHALKDIAGETGRASGKLFTSQAQWTKSIQAVPILKHPFKRDVFTVSQQGPDDLQDMFLKDVLFEKDTKDRWVFKRHPFAKRFVHCDASSTQCPTGLSMVHQSGVIEDDIVKMATPVFEVDFELRIEAPQKPDKISMLKISRFLIWLSRDMGVKFGHISFDMFASNTPLEILMNERIPCGRRSIDSDYQGQKDFVRLFETGRFHQYDYNPFYEELFALHDDKVKRKITKDTTWKDVYDSVCGATLNAISQATYAVQESTEDTINKRYRQIKRRSKRSQTRDEVSWVIGGYKAKGADGKMHGVSVDETKIDGDIRDM